MKPSEIIFLILTMIGVAFCINEITGLKQRVGRLEHATVTIPNVMQPYVYPINEMMEGHGFRPTNITVSLQLPTNSVELK